jgi:hypothetical protein
VALPLILVAPIHTSASLSSSLVLQPESVILTVRWLAGGSDRHGAGLVPASPPRPAQPVASISDGCGDEAGEQVLDWAGPSFAVYRGNDRHAGYGPGRNRASHVLCMNSVGHSATHDSSR